MKAKFLFILIFIYTSNVFSQSASKNLEQQLNSLLANDYFKSTQVSVDIFDLTTNQVVYKKNEKLLLRPASNMKILTTASALNFIGTDYKFKTKVWMNGEIEDSVLLGDIYFQGGCDPDFTYDDLIFLIKEIKTKGIKQIAGNVSLDVSNLDSLFWGEGWMWDDEPSTDFPYLTSMVIDDNAVSIITKPSGNIGEPAIVQTLHPSNFDLINETETVAEGRSRIKVTRDWMNRSNTIIVSGKINADSKEDTSSISIFDPKEYFLYLINDIMEKEKISVEGDFTITPKPEMAEMIFSFERPFSDVIVNLNKNSDNLSAEMTLRALGFLADSLKSSAQKGLKFVDSLISIIGLNPKEYRLADGSGVSHYNLITTELVNQILRFFYNEKKDLYPILYNSFPIGGVDGTLKYRMRKTEAENNVHAKTGTLSGVSSLSGYLTSRSGHTISFSIFMQNFVESSSKAREFQDKICNLLIEGI
ncbi:MAG: D-alanyl-D-alanine carboxypeptidase/D-alanyl-D-alanine-endopeptidase [Ignavibacteriales bacterium]